MRNRMARNCFRKAASISGFALTTGRKEDLMLVESFAITSDERRLNAR